MRLSIFILLLFSSLYSVAQSTEISVPFDNYKYQIKGTFLEATKPNGTAVMIIAGSGPTDRNCNNPQMKSNAYKYLAEHLASKGISSLRYDKLGVAYSTPSMPEKDFVFSDNVKVAAKVYDFLSQLEGVERIVILGHSEGSTVGMLAAKEVDAHKYISLAGPGYPADEILKTQFKTLPDTMKADAFLLMDSLKKGMQVSKYIPALAGLFRPTMNNYLIDWFKYDPRNEIAKLEMPVLVIQGDNDIQVSNDNADELARANEKAQKVFIKGVSHVLKQAPKDFQENYDTYNSPDKDIDEEIKKVLTNFILD